MHSNQEKWRDYKYHLSLLVYITPLYVSRSKMETGGVLDLKLLPHLDNVQTSSARNITITHIQTEAKDTLWIYAKYM